jgi:hypothetical protein
MYALQQGWFWKSSSTAQSAPWLAMMLLLKVAELCCAVSAED